MIADACCILKTWENKRRVKTSKYASVSNSFIFLISCELRSFCVNLTMRSLHCLYRACLGSTRISRGLTLPEERARFVYGSFNTSFSLFKWGKINRFTFVSHYVQYMFHKHRRGSQSGRENRRLSKSPSSDFVWRGSGLRRSWSAVSRPKEARSARQEVDLYQVQENRSYSGLCLN